MILDDGIMLEMAAVNKMTLVIFAITLVIFSVFGLIFRFLLARIFSTRKKIVKLRKGVYE